MTTTNGWKEGFVAGPGSFFYRETLTFRTNGTDYQTLEKRTLTAPSDEDLLTWTQYVNDVADGLSEPSLTFSAETVGGDDYSDAYAESNCYVSGWRAATEREVAAAKAGKFA